jgi:hypothetical protein
MPLIWWSICALAIVLFTFITVTVLLYKRMKRFESAHVTLQTFMSGQQLDTLFQEYIHRVDEQEKKFEKCDERLTLVERKMRTGVDRAELLRFRAFENTGSDLSFAFALLNQEGSGVVLSSIYNREESRVYAKPIEEGQSTYALTDEEKQVINKAMQGEKI